MSLRSSENVLIIPNFGALLTLFLWQKDENRFYLIFANPWKAITDF
jgi:hypothetical protein